MSDKHNCYKCQFRGTVPGSAHSSCNVLSKLSQDTDKDKLKSFELIMGITGAVPAVNGEAIVQVDEYGRSQGWALWPINFDPVWINKCGLFLEKTES